MSWLKTTLDRLAAADRWSYHDGGPAAAEPCALAALALTGHRRATAAERAVDWLTRVQAPDGTVGVTERERTPCWPTALAVLAWRAWDDAHRTTRHRGCIERAIDWILATRGDTSPRNPLIGHDTTLTGWPWVIGTHSWLEPTAWSVLALKAAGHGEHPRTREAVRVLVDRLLPSGGCNYGNTVVMGQELLPHVQPTGLVLLALAGEPASDPRLRRSVEYLERSLKPSLGAASIAFALIGIAANGHRPANWEVLLERASTSHSFLGHRPYTDALVALAALDPAGNPLTAELRMAGPEASKAVGGKNVYTPNALRVDVPADVWLGGIS